MSALITFLQTVNFFYLRRPIYPREVKVSAGSHTHKRFYLYGDIKPADVSVKKIFRHPGWKKEYSMNFPLPTFEVALLQLEKVWNLHVYILDFEFKGVPVLFYLFNDQLSLRQKFFRSHYGSATKLRLSA